MDTRPRRTLGVGFPLLALSDCRDVVRGVSKSGGFGVFGAAAAGGSILSCRQGWLPC
jgi:hypothetical protein